MRGFFDARAYAGIGTIGGIGTIRGIGGRARRADASRCNPPPGVVFESIRVTPRRLAIARQRGVIEDVTSSGGTASVHPPLRKYRLRPSNLRTYCLCQPNLRRRLPFRLPHVNERSEVHGVYPHRVKTTPGGRLPPPAYARLSPSDKPFRCLGRYCKSVQIRLIGAIPAGI